MAKVTKARFIFYKKGFVSALSLSAFLLLSSCAESDSETAKDTVANNAPVAISQSVSTNEDTAKNITLTATDEDGDSLNYTVVEQPSNGALTGTPPNLSYTPNANYNGTDSFTFKANDSTVDSANQTISITINMVNDAGPVAIAQNLITDEDTAKNVTLMATDADGDNLSYTVVSQPSNGTLSGPAPNLTYTPNANYNGSDSFTFKANDGTVDSANQTISISINVVNDAGPVAIAQNLTTDEDTAKNITLMATDADGDNLNYTVVSQPNNGVLSGTAPNLTYTPNANYNGVDSFNFKANDGTVDSATVSINLTITAVNDAAPEATAQNIALNEDTTKTITLTASDTDNDSLSYTVVTQPSNGALTGTAPNLTYTPNANYNGADSFTFKANDGTVDSATKTISITITAVNDAGPVAIAQNVITDEDVAKNFTLTATDADGDNLSYTVVSQPNNGVLSGTAPNLTYTPNANYKGVDSFNFKANDGTVDSADSTISLTINTVNDAPIATAQTVELVKNNAKSITLSATDIDGDSLSYTVVSPPSNGDLTGTPPNLTYTPTTDYTGVDSFTFKANDTLLDSATVTINLTISSAPVAIAQSITLNEDTNKFITLSGTDAEGDSLTYTVVTSPSNGALTGTAPNLTYVPNADYNGADSFTFKVNDGTTDSATATVSLTITAIADITVTGGSVTEGDSGTVSLVFTLTLANYQDVASIDYTTSNGSALAGDDYVAKTGTANFSSGALTQNISIDVNGDNSEEMDENFILQLSNPVNVQANLTINPGIIKGDDYVARQNDTGTTVAGEPSTVGGANNSNCSTTTTMGEQDCHQGRDAGTTATDNADGFAGFSFTKLDSAGKALSDQTLTNHTCVRDNVTGLMWEVKETSGMRSKDNKYRWGGLTAIGRNHASKEGNFYDDWNGLVNYANDTNNTNTIGNALCSFNDWRVPTMSELLSIVIVNNYAPDVNYFPNKLSSVGVWSSSPYISSANAWSLTPTNGSNGDQNFNGARTATLSVYLVRGGK